MNKPKLILFSTLPGHGTGLGFSLAYNIVKAHGGEIQVNFIESDSSAFFVSLPL